MEETNPAPWRSDHPGAHPQYGRYVQKLRNTLEHLEAKRGKDKITGKNQLDCSWMFSSFLVFQAVQAHFHVSILRAGPRSMAWSGAIFHNDGGIVASIGASQKGWTCYDMFRFTFIF
jgi:hypothetical protein